MLKCLIAIAIRAKKVSVSSCHAEWPEMLNLSVILSLKRFLKRYRFLVLKIAFAKKLLISI